MTLAARKAAGTRFAEAELRGFLQGLPDEQLKWLVRSCLSGPLALSAEMNAIIERIATGLRTDNSTADVFRISVVTAAACRWEAS